MSNLHRLAFGLLAVAIAVGFFLGRRGEPPVRYRDVVVTDTLILRGEPDTIVRFVERIVYRTVQAEQQAVAPRAALPDVASFCSAAGWSLQVADTSSSSPDSLPHTAPASVLLLRSFSYDDGDLTLIGPRSNGDLWRGDYRVGRRFQGRVMGDSVFVQTDRWSGARTWIERALWVGGGVAAGYLVAQ